MHLGMTSCVTEFPSCMAFVGSFVDVDFQLARRLLVSFLLRAVEHEELFVRNAPVPSWL